jgi:hypothetical protein
MVAFTVMSVDVSLIGETNSLAFDFGQGHWMKGD